MSTSEKRVALLNIGQSQGHRDVDFQNLNVEIVDVAPLDRYTHAQLDHVFRPQPGEMPISSTRSDGKRILISSLRLNRELDEVISGEDFKQYKIAVLTCTGDFDLQHAQQSNTATTILFPGKLLHKAVTEQTIQPTDKVAILVPVDEQQAFLTRRWQGRLSADTQLKAFTMSPQVTEAEATAAGRMLKENGFTIAIMDCFGYSVAHKKAVSEGLQGDRVYLAKGVAIDEVNRLVIT